MRPNGPSQTAQRSASVCHAVHLERDWAFLPPLIAVRSQLFLRCRRPENLDHIRAVARSLAFASLKSAPECETD
jgi:hypothetical protein